MSQDECTKDDPSTVYSVELWRVQEFVDPFRTDVWCTGEAITREQVAAAIQEMRFQPIPSEASKDGSRARLKNPLYDAERVAYLVENPARDPINIEVICERGDTVIHDGCHRVAAAIFRGDPNINVDYGGYVKAFLRRFVEHRANDGIAKFTPELASAF